MPAKNNYVCCKPNANVKSEQFIFIEHRWKILLNLTFSFCLDALLKWNVTTSKET
jgi:hypothetical protein